MWILPETLLWKPLEGLTIIWTAAQALGEKLPNCGTPVQLGIGAYPVPHWNSLQGTFFYKYIIWPISYVGKQLLKVLSEFVMRKSDVNGQTRALFGRLFNGNEGLNSLFWLSSNNRANRCFYGGYDTGRIIRSCANLHNDYACPVWDRTWQSRLIPRLFCFFVKLIWKIGKSKHLPTCWFCHNIWDLVIYWNKIQSYHPFP